MRAELYKEQLSVAFVWGDDTDVDKGSVRVYSYDFRQAIAEQACQVYPCGTSRMYWQKLVKDGFRRNPSNMPFVPDSC